MKVTWLVLGVGLVFAPAGWAQDAAAVAPKQFKVLAEDDQVRVLEYTDKKGDKVPMHSHPKHMVYVMKTSKVKFSFPDGTSKVSEVKSGQAMIRPEVTHSRESMKDSHAILIELKKWFFRLSCGSFPAPSLPERCLLAESILRKSPQSLISG